MKRSAARPAFALLALLAACRSAPSSTRNPPVASVSSASTDVTTACVAVATDSPRPRVPVTAALILSLRHDPPTRPAAEASVRIQGETSRSTVKIDPASPARFELAPGLYDVRVSQEGYGNLTARVTLSAGCTATYSPLLRGRAGRNP